MPVPAGSRYRNLPPYPAPGADGRPRITVPLRRELSTGAGQPRIHVVIAGDTMESLAHRYLGSAERWWLIADANPRAFPFDLRPGIALVIPSPDGLGRIDRRREL